MIGELQSVEFILMMTSSDQLLNEMVLIEFNSDSNADYIRFTVKDGSTLIVSIDLGMNQAQLKFTLKSNQLNYVQCKRWQRISVCQVNEQFDLMSNDFGANKLNANQMIVHQTNLIFNLHYQMT